MLLRTWNLYALAIRIQSRKLEGNFGIDEIREEVSCQIHQKYINCANHDVNGEAPAKSNYKHSDFEELCVAIKEFMNQKFTDGKHLTEDQKIHHFRELMDALENLGDLKQSEELVIRKHRYFFRRKIKPQERNPTKANENSEASKRIVILKPGPPGLRNSETENSASPESHYIARNKGTTERVGSHFFLSEIKRKLKNAMGKQQHGASTVGISNRLPYKRQSLEDSDRGVGKEKAGSSPGKEHFYIERIAKPPNGIKRVDKTGKSERI
ncbi:uncharacterized protein Pyn_08760 [Prunus yedoensis var. nudiflora]|uniref:DUF3741 domain-containing protein n=1 Tax=Prunus yedoensis var. nudiflora TaxID=2094558 RepID=A0A314Z6Z1_PRUYE|nr:uncharacterized protein Pyn_08760 [Prunus yedoensis var. nudiflora]